MFDPGSAFDTSETGACFNFAIFQGPVKRPSPRAGTIRVKNTKAIVESRMVALDVGWYARGLTPRQRNRSNHPGFSSVAV